MTRSASFDRNYNPQHNNMAVDVASSHEGEEIPLRQMAGLNVQDNYEFASPPSYNDPASEPLQSTNMSDDCSMSSSTTLCGEAEDVELADLEAGTAQTTYQSPAPPTYVTPAPVSSQSANPSHERPVKTCPSLDEFCVSECCGVLIFATLGFIIVFCFFYVFNSISEAKTQAIEGFKTDCVARHGVVQTHMDSYGKESFSCVQAGNVTFKAEGQLD